MLTLLIPRSAWSSDARLAVSAAVLNVSAATCALATVGALPRPTTSTSFSSSSSLRRPASVTSEFST